MKRIVLPKSNDKMSVDELKNKRLGKKVVIFFDDNHLYILRKVAGMLLWIAFNDSAEWLDTKAFNEHKAVRESISLGRTVYIFETAKEFATWYAANKFRFY